MRRMNRSYTGARPKHVIAAAVATVFAASALPALAQSSVTISGRFTAALDLVTIKNFKRAGRNSGDGVNDNTSYIRFSVVEDLGSGLQAIGQLETRNELDLGALSATGPTFVGLRSKSWGQVILGRENLHYHLRASDMFANGSSLRLDNLGIIGYANGGQTPIAAATRTPSVIQYKSPNWRGFDIGFAHSSQSGSAVNGEADIGSAVRRGNAWNLNPNFKGRNFQVGYSYWDGKSDGAFTGFGAPTRGVFGQAAGTDQRGDRLYGSYDWGNFKAGLVWDKARVKTVTAAATREVSNRTAWSIPLKYQTGSHGFYAEYSRANDDKAASFSGLDTKANLFSLAYIYSLSKRTSVSLNYARLNNGAASFYNLYTPRSGTQDPVGVASTGQGVNAGEDPRVFGAAISHYF